MPNPFISMRKTWPVALLCQSRSLRPSPSRSVDPIGETRLKDAVTFFASSIVTMQLPVPVHAPLQPAKEDPEDAVAVSVTTVAVAKIAEQAAPQLIPAGLETTLPSPLPLRAVESSKKPVLATPVPLALK